MFFLNNLQHNKEFLKQEGTAADCFGKSRFISYFGSPDTTAVSYTHLDVYKRQQLRGRGSLPATFYVLTRVKYLILINKCPENKVILIPTVKW